MWGGKIVSPGETQKGQLRRSNRLSAHFTIRGKRAGRVPSRWSRCQRENPGLNQISSADGNNHALAFAPATTRVEG